MTASNLRTTQEAVDYLENTEGPQANTGYEDNSRKGLERQTIACAACNCDRWGSQIFFFFIIHNVLKQFPPQ